MSNVDSDSRIAVNKALQVLEIFRTLNTEMPIGEAVSFLLIAIGETKDGGGLTITELKEKGDFALATSSRYTQSLSLKDRHGRPGHEIITSVRDPLDDRRKILRISPKGSRIIQQIKSAIGV